MQLKPSHFLALQALSAIICLMALAAAFAQVRPLALTGGTFRVAATSINSGSGTTTGGNKVHAYTIGTPSTPMSGGRYTVRPGVIAAVNAARINLDQAHAFPVPFKPSLGHDKITFTRLTTRATINVYTVSGEKVKTLSKNDASSDELVWRPVTNDRGEALASGVYLFVITNPGFPSRKGKLMIIK